MLKKFLIGTFVVALMFVGALALTQKVSAAPQAIVTVSDIQYAATVKLGSSGQAALIWQRFLNGYSITAQLVEDGAFGPLSTVQAKAWQASKGLVADGVLGPMSRAVAMAQVQSGSPSSAFPAGCTSTVGYSSVTGLACYAVNANTFAPAGCTSASGFSPVNGGACYAVSSNSLPAGCSSTAGYSPATGAKCDGGSSSNTGPLAGGAGDIIVNSTSTDVETVVTEGTSNVKVLGFKVEASGSDAAITNLKVTLKDVDTTGSSTRLDRYAGTVSVYMNGTKVGSADVADFTKNGIEYSKSIALSNAIVREGSSNKATFYVTVSALDTIDSVNMTKANWGIRVDNFRFQDATGVVMTTSDAVGSTVDTYGVINSGKFTFSSLVDSGNVSVVVSAGSSNPLAQGVMVSDTSSTKDVLALQFKIKATGTDVTFDSIKVIPTTTTSSIGFVVSELQLRNGSNVLATLDGSELGANFGASAVTFNLDNTFTIDADTTDTFSVYATINDQSNFTNGSTLTVSYVDSSTSLIPEDSNGNTINPTGSAQGYAQMFSTTGAAVQYVSEHYTAYEPTGTIPGTISMTFKVTAFGDQDVNINGNQNAENVTAGDGIISYVLDGATGTPSLVTSSTLTSDGSGNFLVSAGNTETFTLSVKFGAPTGFVQLHINSVDGSPVTNIKTIAY